MGQTQTKKPKNLVSKNLSLAVLIVTAVTFALIFLSSCIVTGVWIANAIQTAELLPEWTKTFLLVVKSITTFTSVAMLVLSIVLAVILSRDKQLVGVYLASSIVVWVFALFSLILSVLGLANVATPSVIGWVLVALYIAMIVLMSITYNKLKKACKEKNNG